MKKKLSTTALKTVLYALTLLIAYLLQVTVFSRVVIFGIKPLLLPTVAVGIAVLESGISGGIAGLATGMLCDLAFNQPMIVFTLMLTAICIAVGLVSDTLLTRGFMSYVVCSMLTLFIISLAQTVGAAIFSSVSIHEAFSVGWRQTLVSFIFIIPAYLPIYLIGRTKPLY